jgi:hypothetical protein
MIQVRELPGQSPALALLRRVSKALGAHLQSTAKTRPGLLLVIAALGVSGIAWAIMKVAFVSGGGILLTLLRDAGHQVGAGGLPGALGGGLTGGSAASKQPVQGLPGSQPLDPDYRPPVTLTPEARRQLDELIKQPVRSRYSKGAGGSKNPHKER